jgi:hypothetical protein
MRLFCLLPWITCWLVTTARGTPPNDLHGMVLCGYQGWFRTPGDGTGNGWKHYAIGGKFAPGHSHIEIWPDLSEFSESERFATPFKHADGRNAEVFSSVMPGTTRRHFEWMREYGIDGVFLQRFVVETRNQRSRDSFDTVLTNCRESANATGRRWALMYDLSGLRHGQAKFLVEDWKRLVEAKRIELKDHDTAYLKVAGKPLVALWGLGLSDRSPMLEEWQMLLEFFQNEAIAGGCSIMLGVPCYWRTLDRDCIADPGVHKIIKMADIISPWAVGRFGTPQDAEARIDSLLKPDMEWCAQEGIAYLPVIFPGFSWQNLQRGRGIEATFDQIPRRGGRFMWSQALAARKAGSESIYIAMFDELDEATAIFKTTQNPPVGATRFIAEPGVPPDRYLRLAGHIGKLLRNEMPPDQVFPE